MLLSILIPLYNEEEFIRAVLDRVESAPLPEGVRREIVVVDDGSTDGSAEAVEEYLAAHPTAPIRLLRHARNQGKGAAIRTAIEQAGGEFSIIQDADLEYDPREYRRLLAPLLNGSADAVFGSRFALAGERRVLYYWHSIGNWVLTTMCNIAADLNLTDMETCYKMFRTSLVQSIPIRSDRFGIEPELTIKLARRKARVYEVPVSYHGRTYEEGKKIGLRDAVEALFVILRFTFSSDLYKEGGDTGPDVLDALAGAARFNAWMADMVRPYLGAVVLEIGAGMGNLTRQLARRRKRYIATDVDGEHLARLRAGLQHRVNVETARCDLAEAADFAAYRGAVDSVVCLNVLEHVADDLAGLRNIYSALAPGGRAIVLVPQTPAAFGTLDAALGHFRRYTRAELTGKMEQAGFQVAEVIEFNRSSMPGWVVNGRVFRRRTLSRWQLGLFDRLVPLWRRVDRLWPWPGASLIAIGGRAAAPVEKWPCGK